MKNATTDPYKAQDPEQETLQREKEALTQQVKRLIRAEGKLYEYQQDLDAQLKEYKALYDLNRRLGAIFEMEKVFRETVAFAIQHLGYERALFFRRDEESGGYRACALDGYYEEAERSRVSGLVIEKDAPCLSPLAQGKEYLICKSDARDEGPCQGRALLLMHEYFLYPLGYHPLPGALLAVGNSSENASFYRRVDDSRASLLSMGNFVGLISSLFESRTFFEEMEEAREQVRHAEQKYRGIFENASEGIYQRTPQGAYLDANPSLAQMLGYDSPTELMTEVTDIGRQLYVVPQRHAEMIRALEAQGRVEGFEARMYRKDRSVIWVALSMRMVRDEAGKILFYEGMAEDISERKRSEEALRESEKKYRQLSEALEQRVREAVDELRQKDRLLILQGRQAVMGEMISNIAHQWRQPLNMLALLVQDLQMTSQREGFGSDFIDSNARKSLEIIRQMSKTIDYFRFFFKPDTEKVEFKALETIEKTLYILEGSFRMHEIRTELEHKGDPAVVGYPNEFVQVLLNILINARDALISRKIAAPRISIGLFTEGEKTVVTIADNAGGIPEEIIDKIFDPYFTTKGPEQGTGIGLFMSKTIVEKNMNGVLSVRNLREGAEFRIEV